MPMVYDISLATPGNLTTSGTPGTETDTFFVKAGVRNVAIQCISVQGMAAALTAITGLGFRVRRYATASTAGTGMTPSPKDPGMQAAKATSASRPTLGTTAINRGVFGCGASTPNAWIARDQDSPELLEGGGALSLDVFDYSQTASMVFTFSAEIVE